MIPSPERGGWERPERSEATRRSREGSCHNVRTVVVTDDAIRAAQRAPWNVACIVAESSGAAGFAAFLSGRYKPRAGKRIGVVVSGANTTAVDFDC
jgi:threonine dehydratase